MRMYLLIAGDSYYPTSGTGDWIGCYESYGEAKSEVEIIETPVYYTQGKKKGEIKSTFKSYKISGRNFDWYEIVDLKRFI